MPPYRPAVLIENRFQKMKDIHPFAQLLNHEDLDDCDWLEHAAFDPIEAATREKIEYRLRTCGELCTGLFSSAYPTSPAPLGPLIKARKFPSLDSSDTDRKRVLLGHIIATKSPSPVVTDAAMAFPTDWQANYQLAPATGHSEDGDTVCIHSLCVHPDFKGKGLGQILLRSYVQRIKDSGVAKRVALICRERLVGFYEKVGFNKVGDNYVDFPVMNTYEYSLLGSLLTHNLKL
ncbi:hypothetical protein GQ44DRAFT_763901 [Phaeosphaeriaceae sp. PMI808]|nr:hypothetical protein GQ44DRAFT_763901 [Phaeosphaeriaceae sp. PMI808]